MKPLVSIVMPIYNGEKYLREAINSILNQSYKNFELIIIDDGSKDKSVDIIKSYLDGRIVLLENLQNIGLIKTLNRGLEVARGEYIARMDQDDISLKNRLANQIEYLEKNLDIALCSTYAYFFKDSNSHIKKKFGGYLDPKAIQVQLLFKCYILHPTVMFRKSIIDKYKLRYKIEDKNVEDYGMWIKISKFEKIVTLPSVGLKYRCSNSSITSSETLKKSEEHKDKLKKLYQREFEYYFGILNDTDLDIHVEIATISNSKGIFKYSLSKKEEYLNRLILKNEEIKRLNSEILKKECKKRFKECIIFQGNYKDMSESYLFRDENFLFFKYFLGFVNNKIIQWSKRYLR
jgi:Glycosyltransferases involved in cell wall biogenesis